MDISVPEEKIGEFTIKGEDFSAYENRDVYINGVKMIRMRRTSRMSYIKTGTVWFDNECKPHLPRIIVNGKKCIMALKVRDDEYPKGLGWTIRKCETCDNLVWIPPSFIDQKIDGAICYENCLKDKNDFPRITFFDMKSGLHRTGTMNIANDRDDYRSSAIGPLLKKYDVTERDAKTGNFAIYYYFNSEDPSIVLFIVRKEKYVQAEIDKLWMEI